MAIPNENTVEKYKVMMLGTASSLTGPSHVSVEGFSSFLSKHLPMIWYSRNFEAAHTEANEYLAWYEWYTRPHPGQPNASTIPKPWDISNTVLDTHDFVCRILDDGNHWQDWVSIRQSQAHPGNWGLYAEQIFPLGANFGVFVGSMIPEEQVAFYPDQMENIVLFPPFLSGVCSKTRPEAYMGIDRILDGNSTHAANCVITAVGLAQSIVTNIQIDTEFLYEPNNPEDAQAPTSKSRGRQVKKAGTKRKASNSSKR